MIAFIFLLMCATSYRITRLITADAITEGLRAFFDRPSVTARVGPWPYELITCAWCCGFWISAGVVGICWYYTSLPMPGLWFGAVACVVGIVASKVDE